ncbi:MAG: transcription antitermination factor NusB [Oscillospiraceae bacterium]|jgi:N utilization substance protein B|nr:transcription antitermination factor NusB [Oscillospiraceae bacterium]
MADNKSKTRARVAARELAMRLVFALFENPVDPDILLGDQFDDAFYASLAEEDELYADVPPSEREYVARVTRGVYEHGAELDGYIEKYAANWEFSRISRTAAAVMRVAMFEVLYMRDEVPPRAAINAAINIAKKYDEADTVAFVNGVLGAYSRSELPEALQ